MRLNKNKYLLYFIKKIPNKKFFVSKYIQKNYQNKINQYLLNSMETFNYIGFKLALCLGANPNIDVNFKEGYHLVTRCARSGDALLLSTLLDFGGDINGGAYKGGYLPIHMAATKGHANIIEILIQRGADINSIYEIEDQNKNMKRVGWTPLVCACQENKTDAVLMLLKLGANHLDKNDLGISILDIATKFKNRIMIKAIFDKYEEIPFTPRQKD